MSVMTRCGAVGLLLSVLMAAPVMAQQAAPGGTSGSSWTDPPARGSGSAVPVKSAGDKSEARTPVTATAPAAAPSAATPAERAAETLGVKPVERTASAPTIHTQRTVVRPRMVERPLVIARRRVRVVERATSRPTHRIARRTARSYAALPKRRTDDRREASISAKRRLAAWGGLIKANRARRNIGAGEGGCALTRVPNVEQPDSIRFQPSPFEGDNPGDVD